MTDFMIEPDELDPERPERRRPVRMVSTGVAPTAAVPTTRPRQPDPPPCYGPCAACGVAVLTGQTREGQRVVLDTHIATYTVVWPDPREPPIAHESRAYPVHRCPGQAGRPCRAPAEAKRDAHPPTSC